MTKVLLPVIAVVPNYNMAESLAKLLPQLLAENYDFIYVLDDASTDDSKKVVSSFAPQVIWVSGRTNVGSGGNRNRILDAHREECIIHFVDADVRVITTDVVAAARSLMQQPNTGFIGGLVNEKNGRQSVWNFGPNIEALYSDLTAQVQFWLGRVQAEHPWWRKAIRQLTIQARREWPDIATPAVRRATYWVHEANMLIRRSTFESLGGFDPKVREHDIQQLAWQAYHAGLVSYFDPAIGVMHLAIQVRNYNRSLGKYRTQQYLRRKHGSRREWLLPGGHFKPDYNK